MLSPRKAAALAAALIAVAALPAPAGAAPTVSTADVALVREINRVRAAYGLGPLALDATLARAARAHTRAMAATEVFAHGAFRDRMLRYHVVGPLVGENLAWGNGVYGTPRGIVAAWLASPPHRANLLHPGFRRVGVGQLQTTFLGAYDANVVTADFAGD